MNTEASGAWSTFCDSIGKLQRRIAQSKAVNVNASDLREEAKRVVQFYFRQTRPELQVLEVDTEIISRIDGQMQTLLRLSNRGNSKRTYLGLLKDLTESFPNVSSAIELRIAEKEFLSRSPQTLVFSRDEGNIYETLLKIVPSAALSYKQAVVDLEDKDRNSYRGVANELREVMRETLDHLAPDKDVVSQPNFKFEKDRKTPTMKQKMRFILKARELPDNAMKPPEDAVEIVEDRIASFTRSVYDRSSISTHIATQRQEVLQMKKYVDVVLAELLGLQI